MSQGENASNDVRDWAPSQLQVNVSEEEWCGWSILKLLLDAPEILVQYLSMEIRRHLGVIRKTHSRSWIWVNRKAAGVGRSGRKN
jgi:hypothetical protein